MVRKLPKDLVLVFVLLLFMYVYFYQDPGWNGNSRFALIFAFVQGGHLTIDSFHDTEGTVTGDKSFYNGHYFSDKAIGISVVGSVVYLPMYWLAKLFDYHLSLWSVKHILTICVIGLPSALAGTSVYAACAYVTTNKAQRYTATIAITLGTMWFPYSVVFFGHALAASLLFCAFFLIFRLRSTSTLPTTWYMFLIGLVLGGAMITEYTTTLVVVPLIIYYFYVHWEKQAAWNRGIVVVPALGGLIPLGMLALYNTLCFGNPFSLGYAHVESALFKESMARGLMGIQQPQLKVVYYLTLHPAHGLFWQSPVLILSLLGTYFMFYTKRYQAEATLTIVALLSYLLMNSGYYAWWGHWASGPRHLIPMLPFLCLPLLFVPKRLLPLTVILSVISVAQMLIVAATTVQVPDDRIRNIAALGYFEYSSIYSYGLRQLLNGNIAWNLAQKLFGWKTTTSILPTIIATASITTVFFMMRADPNEPPLLERQTSV